MYRRAVGKLKRRHFLREIADDNGDIRNCAICCKVFVVRLGKLGELSVHLFGGQIFIIIPELSGINKNSIKAVLRGKVQAFALHFYHVFVTGYIPAAKAHITVVP